MKSRNHLDHEAFGVGSQTRLDFHWLSWRWRLHRACGLG
jgi:hypothetical protein